MAVHTFMKAFLNHKHTVYHRLYKLLQLFSENITTQGSMTCSVWESNPEIERCNQYDWVLVVITAIYMLISNLLLVNLLIALFRYVIYTTVEIIKYEEHRKKGYIKSHNLLIVFNCHTYNFNN